MKKKLINFLGLFLIIFVWNASQNYSQDTPPKLFSVVPHSAEKLLSEDVSQRASILGELIKPVPQSCTLEVYFAFELTKDDYVYVVGQILEKDLNALDEKAKSAAWGNLTYLINKYQMKQFAEAIVSYLKEQNLHVQAPIVKALQQLGAKELDGEIALLLGSPEQYIRHVSLEALISFRSKKAVPALITKLSDTNSSNRYWAIQKLIEINGKEAAPQIAKLIKDEDANIRYWAVDGIAKLKAKAQSKEIWYLINTEQTPQTQAYAIATLVYFEDTNAVKIAAGRIADWKEEYGDILKFIVELHARAIVSSLMNIIDNDVIVPGKHYGRSDIIYCLNALDAKESIGVLRKYMKANPYVRRAVVQVLGNFEAKEAVDDLLDIFYKYLPNPPSNINNDTYESAEAAVALAKIGDPKTWKVLIDVAENPKFPYRSQIIQKLNRQIDANLWNRVQETKVKGVDYKNIKENAEILSDESGIPIVLEFDPQIHKTRGVNPENPVYPQLRAGMDMNLNFYIENIVGNIDAGTMPNTFTYIFDKGKIRIVTVETAVEWWRKNILVKN